MLEMLKIFEIRDLNADGLMTLLAMDLTIYVKRIVIRTTKTDINFQLNENMSEHYDLESTTIE